MPAWHLRPRSGPELVDASVQLLRQHARPLLLLATVLTIPGAAFGLVNALVVGDVLTAARPGALPTIDPRAFLLVVPFAIVGVCWFLVMFGAIVGAASSAYVDGTPIDPTDALRRVRPRAGVLLGSGLLTYLLAVVQLILVMIALSLVFGVAAGAVGIATGAIGRGAGGAVAAGIMGLAVIVGTFGGFLVAGAWLAGRYISLPAVAANETLGVRDTMRRARALSRGSGRRLTGLLLLVGVLFVVVSVGGGLFLGAALGSPVAASVLVSVVNVPLYAFGAVLVAVLYYDLRIRQEGLDIELLAREIAPAPAVPEGAQP